MIQFSGFEWIVCENGLNGPGSNKWNGSKVWLDEVGNLHLKISKTSDGWQCAEVTIIQRLGLKGINSKSLVKLASWDRMWFWDCSTIQPRMFARMAQMKLILNMPIGANSKWSIGNFKVWPAESGVEQTSETYLIEMNGNYTTQRFTWESQQIFFQALHGHRDDNESE